MWSNSQWQNQPQGKFFFFDLHLVQIKFKTWSVHLPNLLANISACSNHSCRPSKTCFTMMTSKGKWRTAKGRTLSKGGMKSKVWSWMLTSHCLITEKTITKRNKIQGKDTLPSLKGMKSKLINPNRHIKAQWGNLKLLPKVSRNQIQSGQTCQLQLSTSNRCNAEFFFP